MTSPTKPKDPGEPSDVAQQIADQSEPDWESASDTTDNLDGMRLISDIANSFRSREKTDSTEPALFEWRHLEVREAIGAGAFGEVYRAYDPVLKREVALKIEHEREDRASNPEMVIAEARSMARTRHPNILAVHGADVMDGRVGIWSDLLPGHTLAAALKARGQLPVTESIELALPIAQALALIHRRGIVHGDVKPANIMMQPDGTPVLMDFGAAREEGRWLAVTLGSPRFMAPELFDDRPTTSASDLFSFGVVLYRCLSGRYPWKAESVESLEKVYRHGEPPSMDRISRGFRALIVDLLKLDPDQRPSAGELVERLEYLRTAPQRRRRRTAVWAVIGSLTVGLLAAITAFRAEQRAVEAATSALEAEQNALTRERTVRELVVGALQAADPERTSGPTSIKVVYDHIAKNMDEDLQDQPPALAEMRLMVGHGLGRLGERERGLAILERALVDLEPTSQRHAKWRSQAWMKIANLRIELKNLDGAEEAVRAAIEESDQRTDSDGPRERLVARNSLMELLGEQGRWKEQLETQLALLADREALHGDNSLRTAVDHHNLSNIYARFGRFPEALDHELRAAELLREHGNGESLRMGFVYLALCSIYTDLENFSEARRALEQAKAIYDAALPPGHPSFLTVESEQARLWRFAKNYDDAERLLLKHARLSAPEERYHQVKAQISIIRMRLDQQRWEEALTLLDQFIETMPARLLPTKPYYLAGRDYAAARMGDLPPAEALAAIDEAIAAFEARGIDGTESHLNLQSWRRALEKLSETDA